MKDRKGVTKLAPRLPYPLAYNLNRLLVDAAQRDGGEPIPLFPYSICALNSLLTRLAAAVGIQSYIRTGARDTAINGEVIKALRKPSDDVWRQIAMRTLKVVADRDGSSLAGRFYRALTEKRNKGQFGGVRSVTDAMLSLVTFRNHLIHGDRITEAEIDNKLQLVLNIVSALDFLVDYELLIRQGSKGFCLAGARPESIMELPPDLPDGEPCLFRRDRSEPHLSLSPLLVFQEMTPDGIVGFDELFFLNDGTVERLDYIAFKFTQQMNGRLLGSYEAFRKFLQSLPAPPIPVEERIDFSSFATDHTRFFVGREDALENIECFVRTRPAPYGVITAFAGMGKTALFARLFETCANSPHRWVFHFCMPTDGRDSPIVALRSLVAQVCDACGLDRGAYLSNDIDEMKEKFNTVLQDASARLPEGARLVVVIDALDEGTSGGSQESVPSVLPSDVPEHVVFLVSYRVDQESRNTRVERELTHLPIDARWPIAGASPLAGLKRENVTDFLSRLANGAAAPDRTVDAVWHASSKDGNGADPFYLRFVADGVESGRIDVARAETIPESLDEAFDDLWMSLPTDRDFLVHRILGMLAIMRDYGDDDMFAYLFGKDLSVGTEPLTASEVALLRAKAGKLLVYDGDRYGLFHDRFRRFLVGEPDASDKNVSGRT